MKMQFYKFSLVGSLSFFLLIGSQALAGITVTSPSSSTSITACKDYLLRYTATSGFSTYVTVEVHQNNSSGSVVKTYSNVSGAYLAANYDNLVSSAGLAPGNYQIKIYDYYNPSFNGWSDIFTISPLVPPSSITIVGSQNTSTGFELMWDNPFGTLEYRIDISTTSDFTNILPAYNDYHAPGSAAGGFYVSGLTPGQDRYVRIRSYNSCSTSANSATVNVSCFTPSTPVAAGGTSIRTCQFTANWNGVTGAYNGYSLIITRTGFSPVTISPIVATTYTYTMAHPSSAYSYKVKAIGCGVSTESNSVSLTTTALGIPQNLRFNGDDEDLHLSWDPVDGALGYRYLLDNDSTFATPDNNDLVYDAGVDVNVVPCNNYYYKVKTIAISGEESAFSARRWIPAIAGCRIASDDAKDDRPVTDLPVESLQPFVFFPSPADRSLTVGLPPTLNLSNFTAETIDATGRYVILPFEISKTKASFDLSGISPGMYIITISDGIVKHRSKFLRK